MSNRYSISPEGLGHLDQQGRGSPIFQISDLGRVGDTMEVLPALIEELKKLKG